MDEDINEYMDENKTPNSREPNEQNEANELDSREYDISTSRGCQGLTCLQNARVSSRRSENFGSHRSFGSCCAGWSNLCGG